MLTLPNHIDKADIDAFVAHVTSEVNEGVVDPLSVHIRCKAVIKALEAILELTEETAKDTASKFGRGEFRFEGASVSLREPRDTPNFQADPVCVELSEQLRARQELVKTAFRIGNAAAIVDPNTGEVVPVVAPRAAKSTLTVTFR